MVKSYLCSKQPLGLNKLAQQVSKNTADLSLLGAFFETEYFNSMQQDLFPFKNVTFLIKLSFMGKM